MKCIFSCQPKYFTIKTRSHSDKNLTDQNEFAKQIRFTLRIFASQGSLKSKCRGFYTVFICKIFRLTGKKNFVISCVSCRTRGKTVLYTKKEPDSRTSTAQTVGSANVILPVVNSTSVSCITKIILTFFFNIFKS